jgi:hypothetical protein
MVVRLLMLNILTPTNSVVIRQPIDKGIDGLERIVGEVLIDGQIIISDDIPEHIELSHQWI